MEPVAFIEETGTESEATESLDGVKSKASQAAGVGWRATVNDEETPAGSQGNWR